MIRSLNALAVRNLGESRVRSLLSIFVVMVGVAMMIATDNFVESMRGAMPGADEGQSIGAFVVGTIDMLMFFAGLVILLVASFLIFNAFQMSVTQRRQQIGMLRSYGMTRRQILQMVLFEGLSIGIVGVVLGMIVGPLIAQGLALILREIGGGMFNIEGSFYLSPAIMLQAGGLGLSLTLIAVLIPAWNATSVSPLDAMRSVRASGIEHTSHSRAILPLVIMLALMIFLAINPPGEWLQSPQDAQLATIFVIIWLGCVLILLPVFITETAKFSRGFLSKLWKVTGRLMADNLERDRQRVSLTVLTMALSLTMIISLTGLSQFLFHTLVLSVMEERTQRTVYAVMPFDISLGIGIFTSSAMELPNGLLDELIADTEGIADVIPIGIAFVPEFSSMFPDMFSYVMSPSDIRVAGDLIFTFSEGDWDTAIPIMESGCGVLVPPLTTNRLNAGVGETFTVATESGDMTCTIAGTGTSMGMASIVGEVVAEELDAIPPIEVAVVPRVGVDEARIEAILSDIHARYPALFVEEVGSVVTMMTTMTDGMMVSLNGILVIAVMAAALGILNTTMMSVQERRHELGLLRAVGASRAQIRNMVMGEAGLMGLVGAIIGFIAGTGATIIFVVTYGGNSVGLTDLPLWSTAFDAVRPAMISGIVGVIVAPLIAAVAAWFPVRNLLKGTAIDTLKPAN